MLRRPPKSIAGFLMSVAILGVGLYFLKGRDLKFSLWGALAMACVYGIVVVILDLVLRRRR